MLRGPENRGAEFKTLKGMERGYPPPQLTRGLGDRRKLPQRGLCPSKNGFWCILSLKNESGDDEFDIFVIFIVHI